MTSCVGKKVVGKKEITGETKQTARLCCFVRCQNKLQTNEVYAATCKRDQGFSIIVHNSCLQLRLVVFWLTYQSCWTMHSETFYPLLFVVITFSVFCFVLFFLFLSSHGLNQTDWSFSVTNALKYFFCDDLSTIGAFSILKVLRFWSAQQNSSVFVCIASNLYKYLPKRRYAV